MEPDAGKLKNITRSNKTWNRDKKNEKKTHAYSIFWLCQLKTAISLLDTFIGN